MNIAILGGSFDPPHIGHYLVVRQILDYRKDIDKILFMPAYKHQWKPQYTTPRDRLIMLKSLMQERTEISEIELDRKGVSYTIDTIRQVKQQTHGNIYWIVGSDIVSEFSKWDRKNELVKEATFLVFPRDPFHLPKNLPKGFEIVTQHDLVTTNISSTKIRNRIQQKQSIKHLVPQKVEKYIMNKKLYKK